MLELKAKIRRNEERLASEAAPPLLPEDQVGTCGTAHLLRHAVPSIFHCNVTCQHAVMYAFAKSAVWGAHAETTG